MSQAWPGWRRLHRTALEVFRCNLAGIRDISLVVPVCHAKHEEHVDRKDGRQNELNHSSSIRERPATPAQAETGIRNGTIDSGTIAGFEQRSSQWRAVGLGALRRRSRTVS